MPYCQLCGKEKTDKELKLYQWGFNNVNVCVDCVDKRRSELILIVDKKRKYFRNFETPKSRNRHD